MKTITIDRRVEAQTSAASSRCSGGQAEIGVLVGRATGGRELVLEALRTPDREGLAAASQGGGAAAAGAQRGGGKGKGGSGSGVAAPALRLDAEWVAEHAAQVARLLPGGLYICGLYVACPAASLDASTGALAALLRELQEEAGSKAVAPLPSLVLHIDVPSGRLAAKEQRAGESTLQPCEVKASDLRGQLVTLAARHDLDQTLFLSPKQQALLPALQAVAAREVAARVRGSVCLVDGRPLSSGSQVADAAGGCATLDVELAWPATLAAAGSRLAAGARAGDAAAAAVRLQGALDCRAVVHRRDDLADAAAALRADMQRSLHARIELAVEEAGLLPEGGGGGGGSAGAEAGPAAAAAGSGAAVVLSLPRRAFLHVPGGLPYSEYLSRGEGAEVAAARLAELLGPEVAGSVAPPCREAEWQPGAAAMAQPAAGKAAASACSVMAVAAGAAAVLVGMAWLQMSS